MAAALAVNSRRDLIALRVEPQSIASQPVAEPEVGPAYFFRPADFSKGAATLFQQTPALVVNRRIAAQIHRLWFLKIPSRLKSLNFAVLRA